MPLFGSPGKRPRDEGPAALGGGLREQQWQVAPTPTKMVLSALASYPTRTAFQMGSQSLTYRATLDLIGRMQGVMARSGVGRGDVVAGLSSNRFEAWCAGVAAHALGAITTPLHPLGSLQDHIDQIEDTEASFLVVDVDHYRERAGQLAEAASLNTVLTLGKAGVGCDLLEAAYANAYSAIDLSQLGDVASLNYTGGTSGRAKGVVRTHRELSAGSACILANFPLPRAPIFLAAAPITHLAGLFVAPVLARGGTVDLMQSFSPHGVVKRIQENSVTFTLLVPSMIYAMLDDPSWGREHVRSLELLVYGASPMSPTRLSEGMERFGPVFCQLYGQTECFVISALGFDDHDLQKPHLLASAGRPMVECDVRIRSDEAHDLAPGQRGEICVRAPYAMRGYWKQPKASEEVLKDGWVHTGDVAWRDEEGRIYIVDRKKDLIVSGGFNIYPRDVEDALRAHPGVVNAAVVGVPDPKWGEAVKAFVVRRSNEGPNADTLSAWVKEKKGSTHAPKSFEFVEELPLTALGKVDKASLRTPFWTGRDRAVN